MESRRYFWALAVILCMGWSYVSMAPAEVPVEEGGPDGVTAKQDHDPCDVNEVMNHTSQCRNPVNVQDNEVEAKTSRELCDCPEFSYCHAIKIGESYECKSEELVLKEEDDLFKFKMDMVDEDPK